MTDRPFRDEPTEVLETALGLADTHAQQAARFQPQQPGDELPAVADLFRAELQHREGTVTMTNPPADERRDRYAAAIAKRDGDEWPTELEDDERNYRRRADAAMAVADAEQAPLSSAYRRLLARLEADRAGHLRATVRATEAGEGEVLVAVSSTFASAFRHAAAMAVRAFEGPDAAQAYMQRTEGGERVVPADADLSESVARAIDDVFDRWREGLGDQRPEDAIRDAILAALPAPADRAAVLSPAERTMLIYALNQAQLRMWRTGRCTDEEQAAVVSLRRLVDGPQPTDDSPAPGESYRHYKGRLYTVLAVAEGTGTGAPVVVYRDEERRVWARPLAEFAGTVADGARRFTLEGEPAALPAPADWAGDGIDWKAKYEAERARHIAVVRQLVADPAAGLRGAADDIDRETQRLKDDGVLEPGEFRPCRDVTADLRRMADEAQQADGGDGPEHIDDCPGCAAFTLTGHIAVDVQQPRGEGALKRAHVALAGQAGRDQAALARVRALHDNLEASSELTSPDDPIARGAAARRIAAALDGVLDQPAT